MLTFKEYLWGKIRANIFVAGAVLFLVSIMSYVIVIVYMKEKQLESSMQVAAYTVREAMNASDWTLALGHLTKLAEHGPMHNIQLSNAKSEINKFTGPFGRKPFGFGRFCKTLPIAEDISLTGCMILFGISENITIILFVFLALGIYFIVFRLFRIKIVTFITQVSDDLKSIGSDKEIQENNKHDIAEIASIREYFLFLLGAAKETSRAVAFGELSAQVAHDVRSPLTALDVAIKDLSLLPEQKRIMIRNAVNRIRDIANNLLNYNRMDTSSAPNNCITNQPVMIMSALDSIISEKRTQYCDKSIKFDLNIDDNACTIFSMIDPVEFKRMISNLINNAVEAIPQDHGKITIQLKKKDTSALIIIDDNGIGMSSDIQGQLFQSKFTFGKLGGSGLGLSHAKKMMDSWGGNIKLQSKENVGTTLTLELPISKTPEWAVSSINIKPGSVIVIFDDDASIHEVWEQRFHELNTCEHQIQTIHFNSIDKICAWLHENDIKNSIYLFDYEIIGEKITGFDLVNEFNLQSRAVLVTSRYEEDSIIKKCLREKIRILPKFIAAYIPLAINEEIMLDAVLIDDDFLIRQVWEISATEHAKNIKVYSSFRDFFDSFENICRNTAIYVDSKLGEDERGEEVAKKIFECGFDNIYLATGMPKEFIKPCSYLKGIQGKAPPWENH